MGHGYRNRRSRRARQNALTDLAVATAGKIFPGR